MTQITEDWIQNGSTQAIFDLYARAGHQLFFVGGCVRNALLGVPVSDLDLSSDAPPQVAMQFLQDAGLRVVPTGIDHGTITVVADGIPHEITTFRKDVETDGRRAVVAFSTNMADDARRRDFTINALYADSAGHVIDPLNGLPDITARRVQFIEDPNQRIREDYLRILRFFRFHARFAEQPPDADTLDAIARNLEGLRSLSAERVTGEVLRLLELENPAPALGVMQQMGVLQTILPGADMQGIAPLVHWQSELGLPSDPITRLTALGDETVLAPLRLSKAQAAHAGQLRASATGTQPPAELGYRLGAELARHATALRSVFFEMAPPPGFEDDIATGAEAVFPISAQDLPPDVQGKAIGDALRKLEADWVQSGFTLTKSQLLG